MVTGQEWVKSIAKTGFGLAEGGMSATIGRANKVLLHGEAISLPPGLTGLPRNLSALPANILEKLPEIIARSGLRFLNQEYVSVQQYASG